MMIFQQPASTDFQVEQLMRTNTRLKGNFNEEQFIVSRSEVLFHSKGCHKFGSKNAAALGLMICILYHAENRRAFFIFFG